VSKQARSDISYQGCPKKSPLKNMPFHGQDAWRRHPLFTNLWKDPLPGFRPAVIVFGVYMVGEYAYKWLNYQMNAPAQLKKGH
jgi:hypothetical protein